MLDIEELGKIAHKAFKRGNFLWMQDGIGVPSKGDIAEEIRRQLAQIDKFRQAPDFESVETSCGCITVRCERENGNDEVNIYLDLGFDFVPAGRRIV